MSNYIETEFGGLVGKTVKRVRPLTDAEYREFYWDNNGEGFIVIFTDGTCFIPAADPEGNRPGFLFLADEVAAQHMDSHSHSAES
jgi:hypothetical protein